MDSHCNTCGWTWSDPVTSRKEVVFRRHCTESPKCEGDEIYITFKVNKTLRGADEQRRGRYQALTKEGE